MFLMYRISMWSSLVARENGALRCMTVSLAVNEFEMYPYHGYDYMTVSSF
jgi:hypothetical protein